MTLVADWWLATVCIVVPLALAAGQGLRGAKPEPLFFEYPNVDPTMNSAYHFNVFVDGSSDYYPAVHQAVQDAAKNLTGENIIFLETKTDFVDPLKFFNLDGEMQKFPETFIINWTHGVGEKPFLMYPHASANASLITADSMSSFARTFLAGGLKPTIRSEPVIEEIESYDPNNGAMVIVGSQFDKLVLDETKDVVLMIFAPWCGFSKRMQPHLDDLSRKTAYVPTLRVMKIDGTKNDIEHPIMESLNGYPYLVFFPGKKKNEAAEISFTQDVIEFDGTGEWRLEALSQMRSLASFPIPRHAPNTTTSDPEAPMSALLDAAEEQAPEF